MNRKDKRLRKKQMDARKRRYLRDETPRPMTPWAHLTPATHPKAPWPTYAVEAWRNNRFVVIAYEHWNAWGAMRLLMVCTADGTTRVTWAEKQRIKNDLAGPERTALEIFPAVSDLVNDANVYHLWVLPVGTRLPFGLQNSGISAGQKPLADFPKPSGPLDLRDALSLAGAPHEAAAPAAPAAPDGHQ